MSAEQAAFVRAICENPADDTARLVYADWLQENGQEGRAQYVRAAVAMDLQTAGKFGPQLRWAQDLFLLSTGRPHPQSPLAPAKAGWAWRYARGFVSDLMMPCDALLKDAGALFAAHPVQLLTLTGKRPLRDMAHRDGPYAPLGILTYDYWFSAESYSDENYLPRELFAHLERLFPNRVRPLGFGGKLFESPSQLAAEHAVSLAAVAFGRAAAGLPEFRPALSVERAGP